MEVCNTFTSQNCCCFAVLTYFFSRCRGICGFIITLLWAINGFLFQGFLLRQVEGGLNPLHATDREGIAFSPVAAFEPRTQSRDGATDHYTFIVAASYFHKIANSLYSVELFAVISYPKSGVILCYGTPWQMYTKSWAYSRTFRHLSSSSVILLWQACFKLSGKLSCIAVDDQWMVIKGEAVMAVALVFLPKYF